MLSAVVLPLVLVACTSPQDTPVANDAVKDATTLPGTGITVQPANSDWIEEQFVTEIISIGLEELGYTVEPIQQADYAVINLAVANGDIEFTTGFYNLGHEDLYQNAGGDEKLEKVGVLVPEGGQQHILIDKKTADLHQISNLEQFKDPAIAKLFDTDQDGLANLVGCQVGWQCNRSIEHFIEVYALEATIEQDQGAYIPLIADVLARQAQDQPVMFFAYAPHWVLLKLEVDKDVVPLEVPFTSLPGDLATMTEVDTTVDGRNLGFPAAQQTLLANQVFVDENPVARTWFEQVKIPLDTMNAESLRIQEGEDTPEDIRS
ncbi:MAG: glycine betaine/L-proline ABC transporter substrate-binding protein ProX, partial [Merismopedia sp. SIO2A8]|nr:glycine betaine/L-proline ABC transporter substrate-binding protein ProX [Merismopedia sp. SIO2A8]